MIKDRTLRFYGIPKDSLKQYITVNNKHGFDQTPEDQYRLENEELMCQADAKALKAGIVKQKEGIVENNEMDFDFTDRSSVMVGQTNMKKPGGDDKTGIDLDDDDLNDLEGIDAALDDLKIEEEFKGMQGPTDTIDPKTGKHKKRKLTI